MSIPSAEAGPRLSTSELVAERIRVTAGQLQPGDRLGREEDLARDFGVSRPTLREALRMLLSEHLIRASKGPGGGIFVAATPEQGIGMSVSAAVAGMLESRSIELDELLETRMLLEIPLAGLAAQRADEEALATLAALVEEAEDAADRKRMGELEARIHRLIAQTAENRLASAFTGWIVDVLQPKLREMIEPAVVEAVIVEQHRELLRAIAQHDQRAAERAMREHLVYLRDLLTAVSASNSRPETTSDGSHRVKQ